jgi:hypothetical protein
MRNRPDTSSREVCQIAQKLGFEPKLSNSGDC